jgi:hypothetical protein
MSGHFTNDELIDRMYAVGGESDHLANCAECARRFDEMKRTKAIATESVPASYEFLAAQRRAIYSRLGEDPGARVRTRLAWAPALAAVALLLAGITMRHSPVKPIATTHGSATEQALSTEDAQLFADVYSMEQSLEPSVAAPIHTLFEENQ